MKHFKIPVTNLSMHSTIINHQASVVQTYEVNFKSLRSKLFYDFENCIGLILKGSTFHSSDLHVDHNFLLCHNLTYLDCLYDLSHKVCQIDSSHFYQNLVDLKIGKLSRREIFPISVQQTKKQKNCFLKNRQVKRSKQYKLEA